VAVAGARAMQLARSWWIALAGIVIVCTGFVAWRVRASGDPSAPVLQKNVATEAPVSAVEEPAARNAYSVCAMARSYRNKTEQKQAAERVQEIVDWLGYHSDPDFRDVFGSHEPGKEPGSGTYRVYVGSARSRRELVPLTDKLTRLVWNRQRPFQNATVKMVEGAIATPGSKDSSDER
jgi:hypothetical protein